MLTKKMISFGALAAACVFGLSVRTSRASTLEIYLQEAGVNGGAVTSVALTSSTLPGVNTVSFTGTYGDFSVTVFGSTSQEPVNGSQADLFSSTTSVSNVSDSDATLVLYASEDGYTLPAGATLNMSSSMGGSINTPTLGLTDIFQGYADAGNHLLGETFTTGLQSATANGDSFDTGTAKALFNKSGAYSLTSVTTLALSGGTTPDGVGDGEFDDGGAVNYSNTIKLTAVPLPATVWNGSAILGLLGITRIFGWFSLKNGKTTAGA